MLIYATKFYVKKSLTGIVFIEKALQWINGSPHYNFDNVQWDGKDIFFVNTKKEKFSIFILEEEIVAIQLETEDESKTHWTSEFILREQSGYNVLSVRLNKKISEGNTMDNAMRFHRPRLMRQILNDNFGENDHGLHISDTPTIITAENIHILHDLICGKVEYVMPVVYVTKSFDNNEPCLDVEELAKDLAGTAHVLVEEGTNITSELRSIVEDKNPFNGAVHIYYTSHMGTRLLPDESMDANKFRYTVTSSVFHRLTLLRADEISWNAIKFKKLSEEYVKRQKEHLEDKKLYDELLDTQDTEIADYKANVQEAVKTVQILENEKIALQGRLQALEEKIRKDSDLEKGGIIRFACGETEFYEGEISDLILEIINKCIDSMKYDSNQNSCRTFHILESVLKSNTKIGNRDTLQRNIKRIFGKLEKLDSKCKKELEGLGFFIQNDENHIKLYFHNDSRYIITLSKTPSDYREGKNVASDAIRILLGK